VNGRFHYDRFVASYLASEIGADTPESVAKALLALDPDLCGFVRRPSAARLHQFRLLLQDIHAATPESPEMPGDDDPLEITGVWQFSLSSRAG
jgi:hypothetical protein